tara:strand:+ start:247 stop:654 length:408 start_codon:yes stop_codon:yes gene_type:complete
LLKKTIKRSNIMSEKKYTKDHEWVDINDSVATIGISNHAQESLGDIVFIDLPSVGKEVKSKEEVCVIESVKAASDIYSPLDGEITEINETLKDDASIINKDPENTGWIFKLKISDPDQINNLLSLDDYNNFLSEQ